TMVGGRGEIKKDVDFPEAGEDTALCDKENKPPRIAQGSSNVFINNQPAARQGDKLECSAAIVGGSPDVFIGGEQVTYLDIQPEFPPWQRMILGGITIASYLLPPTVFNYIECDYNRWRRHSWCGGLSPEQFENQNLA
ncbi:PAAR domain-containing protein, partial [Escherichia sp.]|uniref:PAAR domain-containing protein n=1 Tax=Escherichia sp. TaxID=1884818 RepID=UPI00283F2735